MKLLTNVALSLALLSTTGALAQPANPTFTTGGESSLVTNYSPALVYLSSNETLYMIYVSSQNNYLYSSPNTNGNYNGFANAGYLITTNAPTTGPAATVFNGKIYVAYTKSGVVYITSSANGSTWSTPAAASISGSPGIDSSYKPGLTQYGTSLYLSFIGSSGTTAYVASSADGIDFSNVQSVLSYYPISSAASVAVYNNTLYVSFTTMANHYPLLANYTTATGWNYTIDYGLEIGNDPSLVVYNSALFIGGKSNYSEDNLWMTGTYNGSTFSTATGYGQMLLQSPALALFGNNIWECAKSAHGTNIWCYYYVG